MSQEKPSSDPEAELSRFIAERERIGARLEEIAAERERIAHAALTGDAAARDRLEALKRESAELADHHKDLGAAVAEARRRVAAADAAAHRREMVAAAERRKEVAASLRAAGERADRGAREFAGALAEIEAITRDVDATDIPLLAFIRVRPHMMNAAHTAFLPVQSLLDPTTRRIVPPSGRHSFGKVLGGWAAEIEAEADRVIAGANQEKKEAA